MEKNQNLYDILVKYSKSGTYPFHMPGHKRQIKDFGNPFEIDITEIEGMDNLHHAEGILRDAQKRAARLYQADETYYLVNGSTSGLLAAVSAVCHRGDEVIIARNCHKAVYHAVYLNDLQVHWCYPEMDEQTGLSAAILPKQAEQLWKQFPKSKACILTSPDYNGVSCNLSAIAEIVHAHGAVLIVDGAHGAHFGMHPALPPHALSQGADVVINSLHKTLPSLTQTALLHVRGDRIDRARLGHFLDIYQTSSPSYVFMAAMDRCISMLEKSRKEWYDRYLTILTAVRKSLADMQCLHLLTGNEEMLCCHVYDPTRIVITTQQAGMTGKELGKWLREEYQIEPEMEAEYSLVLISSVCDTRQGLEHLAKSLLSIDRKLSDGRKEQREYRRQDSLPVRWIENEQVVSLWQAEEAWKETVPLQESAGRISGEYLYLYPPGIPLLIPGERITKEFLERIFLYQKEGFTLQGLEDFKGQRIRILAGR